MPLRPASVLGAAVAALSAAATPLVAGEAPPMDDVIQVLADLTLIDGTCRDEVVNFGVAFRFAAGNGIPDVTLMPGGTRRTAFEAALRGRRASFGKDELCGEIAQNYAEALPGSVSFSMRTGQR